MSEIKIRVLEGHRKGCTAVQAVEQGHWDTPWWMPGRTVSRAIDGTERGDGYRFHIVECNSTRCNAKILVSERSLLAGLPVTV